MPTEPKEELKCGLEIHQRLATAEKLFCSCNANEAALDGEKPTFRVERRLRAVAGELGVVDPAAAFEAAKSANFTYNAFDNTTCLVELDEEPPHPINPAALATALEIAIALNSTIVDELSVMRKTVIDGSAVSGFQRTVLIATGGFIDAEFGRVPIQSVCLEEESSQIVQKNGNATEYNLDRLGIPLIEIATGPTLKNGKEAQSAAAAIGLLLRNTQKVARGIGTIRQDLNVSVPNGARCEVKGAQELALLGKIVENEASRQRWLSQISQEVNSKGKKFESSKEDVSELFNGTSCTMISTALQKGQRVIGCRLACLAGLLGRELMPAHRLGSELSDYAKANAPVHGIIHSDEDLAKYSISQAERQMVANHLGCTSSDAWALCVEDAAVASKAIDAVIARAAMVWHGVPKETRRADGEKSRYMRPLPGAARMYPETDIPTIVITEQMLGDAKKALPPSPQERLSAYLRLGLNKELASEMVSSPHAPVFESLAKKEPAHAQLIATTLLSTFKSLSREGVDVDKISPADLAGLFDAISRQEIVKAAAPEVLRLCATGLKVKEAIYKGNLRKVGGGELELLAAGFEGADAFEKIMRLHRLRVDPAELKDALAKRAH